MKWTFDNDRPIYSQLTYLIKHNIVSGLFPAGSPMPSVRSLATEAGVNPNTMQKSLSELERMGLLRTRRTAGRFVTDDKDVIEQTKHDLAQEHMKVFFDSMGSLGIDGSSAIEFAKKTLESYKRR